MTKVVSKASGIMPVVRELVARRMPKHMRMDRKGHLRSYACSLDHPQEPSRGDWRPSLGREDIRTVPLQRS